MVGLACLCFASVAFQLALPYSHEAHFGIRQVDADLMRGD